MFVFSEDEVKALKMFNRNQARLHRQGLAIDKQFAKIINPYIDKVKTNKDKKELMKSLEQAPYTSMGMEYVLRKLNEKDYD